MDSSEIPQGTEEGSSNESGWTTYIASPDHDDDHDDDADEEDDEDHSADEEERHKQDTEDIDSDDSMASDASSGPSDQYGHASGHSGKKNLRKSDGKKQKQQEEKKHHEKQIKAAKDKSAHKADSAGKSKKR